MIISRGTKGIYLFSGLSVLFCLMLSCSSSSSTPTPPAKAAATMVSISVTSADTSIVVGQQEQMTATVTMSDGTTKAGIGTWGSDATAQATVTQTGVVTGISAGDADIYFNEGGLQGAKRMTVRSPWSMSGSGDTVFDMPTYVSEVTISATYTHAASNFIVWIGDELVVNELMGYDFGETSFTGTYETTGGTVQIEDSYGVSWSFTEVAPSGITMKKNTARQRSIITRRPVFTIRPGLDGNREYEIYKHAAQGIR